jgi:hypothetical protein
MPKRWTVVLALAISAALVGAERAAASKIVYSCAPELCVVNPESGVAQKLTSDGATSAYRFPGLARNGLTVAAARGADVMVGDYGSNLTQRWAGSRDINDVALAPDGSGVAESHSYVETRYGCPLTGGCLELVDMSASEYTRGGDRAQGFGRYRGGGGVGFLGGGALISSGYVLRDKLHHLCVVDTPGVPEAPCVVRVSSPAALFAPDGSADGRFIVSGVAGEPNGVVLFDAATGATVRRLADGGSPSFSPDGRQVAFVAADGWIYTVPVAGGTPRKLVQGVSPSWGEGDGPGPSVSSTTLRTKRGTVPVKLACAGTETCSGTLRIKKGSATLGRRAYRVAGGRSATVKVTPGARGKRTIARSRSHKVTVELKPRGGSAIATKLTLRR